MEYPGGKIILATYSSETRDIIKLRELTDAESSALRSGFNLEDGY
jgi:hypothetical protein